MNLVDLKLVKFLLNNWGSASKKTAEYDGVKCTIINWNSLYESQICVKFEDSTVTQGVWLSDARGNVYISPTPVEVRQPARKDLAKIRVDRIPASWFWHNWERGGGNYLPFPKELKSSHLLYFYWADAFNGFDRNGVLKPFLSGQLKYTFMSVSGETGLAIAVTVGI